MFIKTSAVPALTLAAYADILGHMRADLLQEMITGTAGGVPITQATLLVSAILMVTTIGMGFLSLTLSYCVNRWVNIIVSVPHICLAVMLMTMPGTWAYSYIYSTGQVIFLSLIVWTAWKWPKQESQP